MLERGIAPETILALGRNDERPAELADQGLRIAQVDLEDPASIQTVLTGVAVALLISIGAPGQGLPLRTNAVTAAKAAGVGHLVYTSALLAPTTRLVLAAEHKATEEVVRASGIPATFLRNGWYTGNHRQDFTTARQHGVIANSIGTGRLARAPRRDYAEAAAAVLTTPGHEGRPTSCPVTSPGTTRSSPPRHKRSSAPWSATRPLPRRKSATRPTSC